MVIDVASDAATDLYHLLAAAVSSWLCLETGKIRLRSVELAFVRRRFGAEWMGKFVKKRDQMLAER